MYALKAIKILNTWPEGSLGEQLDHQLLCELHSLGQVHGYERVVQAAQGLSDILLHNKEREYIEKHRERTDLFTAVSNLPEDQEANNER